MEQKQEFNEHFKIILLGNNFVGKSRLLLTYCGGQFYISDEYMDTMGVDQGIKKLKVFNKIIQLRIWDASGSPKLLKIVSSYFRSVDGALICFDLTNRKSFIDTKEHIGRLREVKKNIPMILVGCKADLDKRRDISLLEAKEWAKQLGVSYLEVSSLAKENIEQPFTLITNQIYIAAQLNRLKPKLEECLNHYLQIVHPPSRSNFFSEQNSDLGKEGALKEEYKILYEKLLLTRSADELKDIEKDIMQLLDKANDCYKVSSPFLSSFVSSPLAKALKQTLDCLKELLAEMQNFPTDKEMVYPKKLETSMQMVV